MVGFDEARFLQRPDPAKTGRRSDFHPIRQFDIGHAAIGLQLGQYLPVNGVKTVPGHGTPGIGK
jgi:hypothetical protein